MLRLSHLSESWQQSGIRAASQQCAQIGGINLGQGVCNLPTPAPIVEAAVAAMQQNHNTYSACEGVYAVRAAIANKLAEFNRLSVDPETEVIVTHGSTGAFVAACLTLLNPGDEVILFEPFYGYHKNILQLLGMTIRAVPMSVSDMSFAEADLKKAITARTRAIVLCTPCNPNGKVFSRDELMAIGKIAEQQDLCIITDEIYEYITYPGYQHISLAALSDFRARTVTISGFSKTYNMTGWRLGYAAAPAHVIAKMALLQDLLYVCPVTPLQYAMLAALAMPKQYYDDMREQYLEKRDFVVGALSDMGFQVTVPQGAYYLMADFSRLRFGDDVQAAQYILQQAKVATVPGRSFYMNAADGAKQLRFCFALTKEHIEQAILQIKNIV